MSNIADETRASKFYAETGDTRHAIDLVDGVSLQTTSTCGQCSLLLTSPLRYGSSAEWQLLRSTSVKGSPGCEDTRVCHP